jgi:hypothetical protein
MSSAEEKPRSFSVNDRRTFTSTGEARDSGPTTPADNASPEVRQAAATSNSTTTSTEKPSAARPSDATSGGRLPPVDFPTFVLSLGSSVLMHLGEGERPEAPRPEPNLLLAKHTIDILSMLQEKTKGNLSPPEQQLLENLLYDLRLRYVAAAKP